MSISPQLAQSRLDYFANPAPVRQGTPPLHPESATKSADNNGLFGADGFSFRDVFDAINPLNHIPVVSDLFASATEHTPSPASRLMGSTLLGGPIGFVASLASVIFENATGQTPTQAVAAALTNVPESATVLASNDASTHAPEALGSFDNAAPVEPVTVAALTTSTLRTPVNVTDAAILDLYGASASSAHASYSRAQLRPYLADVTVSRVL